MKRWTILLGRGGAILIAIGCATFLVSLIPSATVGNFKGNGGLWAETWDVRYENVLSPQQGLSVSVTANSTIKVYLLEVRFQTIYEWINETHPHLYETNPSQMFNETYLTEFLEANPQTVAIEREIGDGGTNFEYTPTKVTNVSLVFCNPNPSFTQISYEGYMLLIIAPKAKMQILSQITIPVGFVLTLPWIVAYSKTKKKSMRNF
ncbi:MAG: hypothetical protein QXV21_01610 [Candidatus Bathyarchaeia archaeon]